MTAALALATEPRAPSVDVSKMVQIDQAAVLLGCNTDALRRKCRDEFADRGLAVKAPPPFGGKPTWFLARDLDVKLCSDEMAELHREPDLTGYTDSQRQQAYRRRAAVHRFRQAKKDRRGPVKQWLPSLLKELERDPTCPDSISRAAIYKWDKAYQRASDLHKLVDLRGGDQKSQGAPAAWDAFRDLYLDERQPTIRSCWEKVRAWAKGEGVAWCSYESCRRQLDQRIPPEQAMRVREPKRYRDTMEPRAEIHPDMYRINELWEGDHSQLDFWVTPPGGGKPFRPWVTAWKCWRSRRVVGWVMSESPNSSTIRAAFRRALLDEANHGGPLAVAIDNGKDYESWFLHGQTKSERKRKLDVRQDEADFNGLFEHVGVKVHFTLPYNPTGKSRVERWFGILHDRFDREQPTYCGRDHQHRPESLAKMLRDRSAIPTFDQVREQLDRWIRAWNASAEHSVKDLVDDQGVKLSPDDMMARCDFSKPLPEGRVLDLMLHRFERPVPVTKRGVTIRPFGVSASFGAYEPALAPYKRSGRGKKRPLVFVSFDPDDTELRGVQVWDSSMRWICEAKPNRRGGELALDRRQAREHAKDKAAYRKAVHSVTRNSHLEYLTDAELMEEKAAERERPQLPAETPTKLRFTGDRGPFEDAAKRLQRHQLKADAEAENPMRKTGTDDRDDAPNILEVLSMDDFGRFAQEHSRSPWEKYFDDAEPIPGLSEEGGEA